MADYSELFRTLKEPLKDGDKDNENTLNRILTLIASDSLTTAQLKSIIPLIIPYLKNINDSLSIPSLMIINSIQSQIIETPKLILDALDTQIELSNPIEFINILTNLSHLMNDLISGLCLNNTQVINLITNQTIKISNDHNIASQFSILSLFSSLCLNDECKSIIAKSYQNFLISSLMESASHDTQCMASLVIIKLWRFLPLELLNAKKDLLSLHNLSNTVISNPSSDVSIETLSLISSNLQIKSKLRANKELINLLLNFIKENKENSFGALSIIENLSLPNKFLKKLNPQISNMHDKNDLSNVDIFTNKLNNGLILDNVDSISEFNSTLIANDIIKLISTMFKLNSSSDLKLFKCIKILSNLAATNEITIPLDSKKEIIKTLIASLLSSSSHLKYNHKTFVTISQKLTDAQIESRLYSIRTISNLLISKDFKKMFDSENDIISTIPFLLEFPIQYLISTASENIKLDWLTPFSSFQNGQLIDINDLFNSIGSVSNILALDLTYPKNLTYTLALTPLLNLLENINDSQIQSVILKLLSNLVQLPICCAKFFNWESEKDSNFANFNLLFKFFKYGDVNSIEIFFNVADFQPVLETLSSYPPFIKKIQDLIFDNKSDLEFIEPLIYIIRCLLQFDSTLSSNFSKIKMLTA